jgi:hypothetical protein
MLIHAQGMENGFSRGMWVSLRSSRFAVTHLVAMAIKAARAKRTFAFPKLKVLTILLTQILSVGKPRVKRGQSHQFQLDVPRHDSQCDE